MKDIPNERYTKVLKEKAVKLVTQDKLTLLENARRLSLLPSTLTNRLKARNSANWKKKARPMEQSNYSTIWRSMTSR
jgi:transposase-like protein